MKNIEQQKIQLLKTNMIYLDEDSNFMKEIVNTKGYSGG
jgi:hypothetical protein